MIFKARTPPESVHAARTAGSASRGDWLADLGRRAAAGDDDALERLLAAIAPDMLRVIRSVLGASYSDLEDLLQDCLLGFMRALAQFRYESSVTTFALTIAFRHALAAKRRQRDVVRWIGTFQRMQEPLMGDFPPAGQEVEIEKRRTVVAELLATIPKPQAEALGLRAVVGLSIEEIARSTAVPANTVRSRLRLAKESLRRSIESDEYLRELLEPQT